MELLLDNKFLSGQKISNSYLKNLKIVKFVIYQYLMVICKCIF